jgi:hypothetical protein
MLDIKTNLRTYMTNFTGSYIGFFSLLSEIIYELGEDWGKWAEEQSDADAKKWSVLFIDTSKTLKQISNAFTQVSDEFNKREIQEDNPQSLIENFKNKVNGIKDAKSSTI